jgi:5-(carboxyamino)imidazole ribonucleotide synthase
MRQKLNRGSPQTFPRHARANRGDDRAPLRVVYTRPVSAGRVGILGGGQLALMTAEAAPDLGVEVHVLEREAGSPAGQVVGPDRELVGDWRDERARAALAERVDIVTLENEFVDADALAWLVARGCPVYPEPEAIRLIQDKLDQKSRLAAAGLPVPPFRPVASAADVLAAAGELGWPLVLKARRNGYDGYGNARLSAAADVEPALVRLGGGTSAGGSGGLFVEQWVPFERELACMVVRGRGAGAPLPYPVVETVQRDHICHEVVAPADLPPETAERACQAALGAVEATGAVGVVGVELFLLPDGEVLLNELAPRPHNSGHYTIEGCHTSQFANHLLAVLGRPLGSTDLVRPAAAMVNLLGTASGPAAPRGVEAAAARPETHLHIYGKRQVRPGRKMGHVTALGGTAAEALARARQAAALISW